MLTTKTLPTEYFISLSGSFPLIIANIISNPITTLNVNGWELKYSVTNHPHNTVIVHATYSITGILRIEPTANPIQAFFNSPYALSSFIKPSFPPLKIFHQNIYIHCHTVLYTNAQILMIYN